MANADVPRDLHDMIETAAKPGETTQKSEADECAFLEHKEALSRAFGDDSTREGIFSHLLGPSRYFQIMPVIVRWYIPLTVTLAVVTIVDQVAGWTVPGSACWVPMDADLLAHRHKRGHLAYCSSYTDA